MKLQLIDILIIVVYLIAMIVIGLLLKKRASKNLDSYFLGGKKLPFYMLGLSDASGMFDISGTMWMVYLAFVYGFKSLWIPWLWPVFNQVFLMIYLSVWLRRSNVLTGAEWIRTRFGYGRGANLSHTIVILYAIIGVLGFLSYGFIGIGKFMEVFFPWEYISPYVPIHLEPESVAKVYGIFFTTIATSYVMLGGMHSIVWADVVQFSIMTISGIIIATIAMNKVSPEMLAAHTPKGWDSPFFGWKLDLDWGDLIPSIMTKIQEDQYSMFTTFVMMMLFKGVFMSMAGPAANYDMQKILACRSPREAALMSGSVSVILLIPRYLMIMGFTVLALVFFSDEFKTMGNNIDFETILPKAINEFAYVGLVGILLAGLLAAFMSTFASTVNAAQAYLVNDVFLKYIHTKASSKTQIRASYIISVLVVVVSTIIGLYLHNINSILQWIVSALYGGYIAANVLKWHWWRFNGNGFFSGMFTGIVAAMVAPLFFPDILPLYYFPILMCISLIGCIAGTLLSKPTEDKTLIDFYIKVRPWGFWDPIIKKAQAQYPDLKQNKNFKRDMFNIVIGIVWQCSLTLIPMYIVVQQGFPLITSILVLSITSLILKKNWYDKMNMEEKEYDAFMKKNFTP
ncbi:MULTISPECIES: sodium:solute symporter family protein [unclassified Sphingobacterium]|uniref:sodium:solute symporter family protein n=1 Tax=unclassified Sphingobacterium TaxID=2609468 RepID=UPI001051AFE7|nr:MULTISPECIES: sodium:solute symporter family protein [unclassified Sphingobacterium]MCS3557210.1 Na+/proline symporter [Sphingobacterium sp. JUb21]TCQ97211.1 Na+/proline symporter [Sphingobacterium sp. JUb20]